jgi:L-ascorbate metabolism protein UlaG (beta-lactamase superfamily)
MTPKEAARAAEILGARTLLSGHAWDEPFERALAASEGKTFRLLTPRIGEPVRLEDAAPAFTPWWKGIE